MLCRRAHPLRKSSRRLSQCPKLTSTRSDAEYGTTHISKKISNFPPNLKVLSKLQFSAVSDSETDQILTVFASEVRANLWGDPALQLATAISLLKQTPDSPHLRLVAERLADISPAQDINARIWTAPETLLWWEDLVQLLPCSTQYSACLLAYIRSLREALIGRTLSIGHFQSLRQLAPEQLSAFLRLLRIEHVNELAEDLMTGLAKAWTCIDQHTADLERISSLLQRKSSCGDYEALLRTVKTQLECFYAVPLQHYELPAALKALLELSEQSPIRHSLNYLLPYIAPPALPLLRSDISIHFQPLCHLSEYEEAAYFQRALLQLSFPQVLLCAELSSEPRDVKERLAQDWQLQHQLSFPVFLRETFFECMGGRVCVFTRDMRDTQLRVEMEYIREKASGFRTVEELNFSLEAFLQSPSQRLYVLDYFLDTPQSVSWESAKEALETAGLPGAGKLLCLLLRLPPDYPALPGVWNRSWRLISMESLTDAFSSSLERLQLWLKRDTSDILLDRGFLQSTDRVETILSAAMSHISSDDLNEIRDLARDNDFCALLCERLRQEANNLPDWKELALHCSPEASLEATVDKVVTTLAVSLLTPVLCMAKSLHAFSSFLLSSEDSLSRRLWKATFLQLAVESVLPAQQAVTLRYPFILKDYHNFLLSGTALSAFHELSVTTLHLRTSQSSLTLLHQYMEDLMTLDLAKASYEWQGRKLLESLCGDCKTFEEVMSRYCGHRTLVLALCKADRMPLLDNFFDELLGQFPGKQLRKSRSELVYCLENQQEELCFIREPSSRLFAIGDRCLLIFSCLRKRIVRQPISVETKQPSLMLLELSSLFCCGGRVTNWLRDHYADNVYILTLPRRVSPQACMLQARGYHGLALCQREVYAIGGVSDLKSLRICEKFSLDVGKWLELPQQLIHARSHFTPLVYMEMIYVFGGMCESGEVIDVVSNSVTALPISLPACTACISLLIRHSQVLILSGDRSWEVDLDSLQCREQAKKGGVQWSSCCPVLCQGEIVWVDKDCTFQWLSLSGQLKGSLKQPS